MSEPITWQVIQYIKSRLLAIDGTDGWYTSLGSGTVLDDESQYDARSGEPAAVIRIGTVARGEEQQGNRLRTYSFPIVIDYAVPIPGATNPALLAHRAMADIRRALMGSLRGAPVKLTRIDIVDSTVDLPEGSNNVIAQVNVQAGVSETLPPPA